MLGMVSRTNTNPNSDTNVDDESAATQGLQKLATMYSAPDMYAGNGDVRQQQQPPMTPGVFDNTNDDRRTLTIRWQPTDGKWAQAKVLITDQIRNSYVHSLVECFPAEKDLHLAE